jgi:hypothetical protein
MIRMILKSLKIGGEGRWQRCMLKFSWPDPEKKFLDYYTQNDGECETCALAKGVLDCGGNKYAAP